MTMTPLANHHVTIFYDFMKGRAATHFKDPRSQFQDYFTVVILNLLRSFFISMRYDPIEGREIISRSRFMS
jgi:hypothetical protein